MRPDEPKLSTKQLLAVQSLATGSTIGEAALHAKVTDSTVDRWLKLPEFRETIQEAKRDIYGSAIAQIVSACTTAVETLQEIAKDKKATTGARVSAAKVILETAYKGLAHEDLEARIKALEESAPVNERY